MAFITEMVGNASLMIHDGLQPVCEIRDLRLQNVRFRRDGRLLIGADVPLPLYWEQYANHEHPERNSGSHGSVRVLESHADRVVLECTGATRSRSVSSTYLVTLTRGAEQETYTFDIHAALRVDDDSSWHVTPNPHHGELEFCNFWPEGVFSGDARTPLLFEACYVKRGHTVDAIPHHHLESPDKHNILLRPGDRMMWLLEDENPCIELVAGGEVAAGVCAYMWDAHLAYRVCFDGMEQVLRAGTQYSASFRLLSLGREEGKAIAAEAVHRILPEVGCTPVIVDGVHTFSETVGNTKVRPSDAWPWETEVLSGDVSNVRFSLDQDMGMDDLTSLRIDASGQAATLWKATALGPAFRQALFESGSRYRLTAYVRSQLISGNVSIALRLHREGSGGLFEPRKYEVYRSAQLVSGQSDWARLEVLTPPIAPAPDRVHLLLEMDGAGTCWFDNVHFAKEK